MRFQTEPINFHDSQTGQVRLKPLKREIDRRIHNILAYLLNQSQQSTQKLDASTQYSMIQPTRLSISTSTAPFKNISEESVGVKIPLSQFLSQEKQKQQRESMTRNQGIRSPLKEVINSLPSANNSQESLSKKNIEEESFSKIFGPEHSIDAPHPFSLNINLDNIENRSLHESYNAFKSTERSNKKRKNNKENDYETPYMSHSKKNILHKTPSCSTVKRLLQQPGRPTHPCVAFQTLTKIKEQAQLCFKKTRKEANENNVRKRLLKRIESIPCTRIASIP